MMKNNNTFVILQDQTGSRLEHPWVLDETHNRMCERSHLDHTKPRQRFRELKHLMLMTVLMPGMLCWTWARCRWSPLRQGIYQPKPHKPLFPSEQREKSRLQSHDQARTTQNPAHPEIWKDLCGFPRFPLKHSSTRDVTIHSPPGVIRFTILIAQELTSALCEIKMYFMSN